MIKNRSGLGIVLLALILAAVPAARAQEEDVPVVPTGTSDSVHALLYARPFILDTPYADVWTRELQPIDKGTILVLAVDTALVRPRDTWMPVLYVGARPAETVNIGMESGHVVVLVPGEIDLYATPAYFGSVQLPERVDRARGEAELAAARAIGVGPFPREMVDEAIRAGGSALRARSIDGVYKALADVIEQYSPQERELADRFRLIPSEN